MTVFRVALLLWVFMLAACSENRYVPNTPTIKIVDDNHVLPVIDHHPNPPSPNNNAKESQEIEPPKNNSKTFRVQHYGETYTAKHDQFGDISIVDYPQKWRGEAKVDRIDFEVADLDPFSLKHCERLKRMAQNGMGEFVRSAFHTRLIFEVPPFLASNFVGAVRESARSFGIHSPITAIKNSIDHIHGALELSLNDQAIARVIGNISQLSEQLNLSQRGSFVDENHKAVLVVSGDVICDLIAGNAHMKMSYAIVGTNQTVDIYYDPLIVDL